MVSLVSNPRTWGVDSLSLAEVWGDFTCSASFKVINEATFWR